MTETKQQKCGGGGEERKRLGQRGGIERDIGGTDKRSIEKKEG